MNGVPENRGAIERAFGTFAMDFAPRLSGHTFSSIIEKGDADPEARAALTVDDFTFALQRWVIDIYHNTPHRGLGGETPANAWRRLSKEYGVLPPPDMKMTRLCFGYEREYRLDKTGITILGVRYHNDELAQYMLRKDPRMVDVRWHPKDIGWISVKLGQKWFDIPALDHSLDGIAAQTWLTAVRHVRSARPKSNRLDMIAVREAMKAIAERNKAAMAAASLNVEDWSDDRVARAEADLMAGVEFFERKGAQKVDGDLGHEIPSTADLTGAPVGDVQEPGDELKPSGKSNFSIEED